MSLTLAIVASIAAVTLVPFTILTKPVVMRRDQPDRVVSVRVRCGYQVARGNWITYPFVSLTARDGIIAIRSRFPMYKTDVSLPFETVTTTEIRGLFPFWRLVIRVNGTRSHEYRVSVARPRQLQRLLESCLASAPS